MKIKYDREKELYIFDQIKDKFYNLTDRTLWSEELREVEISERSKFIKTLNMKVYDDWYYSKETFLKELGKFYDRELEEADNLTCYLVRFTKAPYYYKSENPWFCAPLLAPPMERLRVMLHELCHYYQPLELKREIKEAIPVIINHNNFHMNTTKDVGHRNSKEEQEWRKIIWDLYEDGKTIWDLKIS